MSRLKEFIQSKIHKVRTVTGSIKQRLDKKIYKSKRSSRRAKVTITLIAILLLIALSIFYYFILKDLPNPKDLKNYKVIPVSSQIYDRNGKLLYEVYKEENRNPVSIEKLPKHIKYATIAIEDADFYKHSGISFVGGMIRAFKDTVILRKGLQGGSTLTQQLVKSALLTPERTIQRKTKEIVLALWTEQIFTKDEILELYLNQVPYGGVSYGIEEGAQLYFRKSASKLTLAEAAFLAGLPRAPSIYSPYTNFTKAKSRQKEVLKRMYELNFISDKQYKKALNEKLQIKPPKQNIIAPHFVFYVKSILEKQYGTKLVEEGGLRVITSLDSDIQASAEAALVEELEDIKRMKVSNGALLVTRPVTGEILSMIGSVDFFQSGWGSFNVTTALRQPGSSIKPINYAIGIDQKKVNPATVFLDVPTCFDSIPKKYCPKNYDGTYHGPVQLRFALGSSYNIPAVKMLALNGVENFITQSKKFLFTTFRDPKNYGLSLTLGGGEVKMTEMAQAFSAFANQGVPRKLVVVLKVTDKNGEVLYEYKDPNYVQDVKKPIKYPKYLNLEGKRAVSPQTAFLISHILLDNYARSAAFGSRSKLIISDHAVSVKTGTTNDLRDNWTVGYTPNFLTIVWVGNNDNSPMNPYLVSGVTGAAPIWNRVMSMILENQPDLWPKKPAGVVGKKVCVGASDLKILNEGEEAGCQIRYEYFIDGTENLKGNIEVKREFVPVSRDTGEMVKEDHPNYELQEKTVLTDSFARYCIDCAHPELITPTPNP